jgi:hypothetical protein
MNKTIVTLAIALSLLSQNVFAEKYGEFYPSKVSNKVVLVPYDSKEGKQRLIRSEHNTDFFQLTQFYTPQSNPLYCGIASSVMVLNALRKPKNHVPSQKGIEFTAPPAYNSKLISYKLYNQSTFLNSKTDRVKKQDVIELKNGTPENWNNKKTFNAGLSLNDLKGVLKTYKVKAVKHAADSASDKSISKFRKTVKKVLKDKNKFIIVNFKRQIMGERNAGGGHHSPLAAYDAQSDSVLVLDVAGHKVPWYWAPVAELYAAMNSKDGKNYRGYVVVSE